MSFALNPYRHASSASIVTDGLILYLDAGDPSSYPGTGTDWYDQSGNSNDGTLVNGVSYDINDGGSLVFDGINDYIRTTVGLGSLYSLELSFKIAQFTSGDMRLMGAYTGNTNQFGCGWSTTTFRMWLAGQWMNTTFNSIINEFYTICITHESNDTKLYVNGEISDIISGRSSYFSNIGFGNPFVLQYGSYFQGNIYQSKIYNRALQQYEIQQNYNALRDRFGI